MKILKDYHIFHMYSSFPIKLIQTQLVYNKFFPFFKELIIPVN